MEDQAIEQSPQERMEALLGDDGQFIEEEQEQTEGQAEEGEESEEVEESDEDNPEPQTIKLKRGDEEVEIPVEEAVELAQKGYDYTKKTQELAESRKQVEARVEHVQLQERALAEQAQINQQFIQDIASITAIDGQLAQYKDVNWQQLSDQDPVQAQKLFFSFNQLQVQRTQAVEGFKQKQQHYKAATEQQRALQLQKGAETLKQFIPDWNAEKAADIRKVGKDYGFTDTELNSLTDPRAVRLLHDAVQYRKLKDNKPNITNKVVNKPAVVKPGGKDTKVVASSKYAADRAQLRKTGDQNLAAKLIERML